MTPETLDKLKAFLTKMGFHESGMTKGYWEIKDGSHIVADLRGEKPIVGVMINGMIHTTGHGVARVGDYQTGVEQIMKEAERQQEPEKKGKTTAKCASCAKVFEASLDEMAQIQEKHGNLYCQDCKDKPHNKVAPEMPALKIPKCRKCGVEVPHARALECMEQGIALTCEDCEEKGEQPKGELKEQEATTMPKNKEEIKAPEPQVVQPQPIGSGLLDLIKSYVGNDVLEVFGDSGTGKSKLALELARQVIASGKTVFYLDTERNLTSNDIAMLKGSQYKYTPVVAEIGQITRQLPKVDVVIIDSIGFPILTAYARMNMKQKGDALLNMIAIFGDLKEWAYRNNSVAIVINQPESDFNKEPGHLIRPFGDKSQFAAKEIWKTEIVSRGKVTKTAITAFRSRSVGHGTKIADMEVSDAGVTIIQNSRR